ncbi:Asp-tRNA(Asn)/Glu-tRNA(Gln) amidotransferase subunit GatA, partial [Candidatus Uhrbacteria bacterium]|nr:Asp-tRNA(Asn)/Glu-tRNA(Gln) amidotransferase subunit GatA [Candidatus Uhrbacteria bacterium]
YGLFSMTSSTDCTSFFTKTTEDAAILLQEIAGQDEKDGTTVPVKVPDYSVNLKKGVKGLKIGVPKEYFIQGMNPAVEKTIRDAIKQYEELGAEIHEVSLPHTKYALAVYYIITPSEVSTNLSRYDGIRYGYSIVNDPKRDQAKNLMEVYTKSRRYGFGAEAKRRIMVGAHTLSSGYYDAYYVQASKVRTLLRQDFAEAFKKVDLLLTPTSPDVAFKIGQKADPLSMYLEDLLLTAVSLAGVPAVTLPSGFAAPKDNPSQKLPVGLQLIANYFDEASLLWAAYAYEQSTEWHKMKPPIS